MKGSSCWPESYLVGSIKSGSTSLHQFFRRHPAYYAPEEKYLRYFVRELNPIYCAGLGEDEHREGYLRAFKIDDHCKARVDCDVVTMLNPVAASRIASVRPDAKILAVLRNPIERTWSHYRMNFERGLETRAPEAALFSTPIPQPGMAVAERYVEASLYHRNLAPFLRYFGRKGILLIDFAELQMRPELIQELLAAHLGVTDRKELDLGELKENAGYQARNELIRAFARLLHRGGERKSFLPGMLWVTG